MESISLRASVTLAEKSNLDEFVRNPVIGNYNGYAEIKMTRYDNARAKWESLTQRGNAEVNFNISILHEDGLGGLEGDLLSKKIQLTKICVA